ncbi:hypothetical protein SeLEV6574_g05444 [Synchytrium endobioticum]|uniref:Vacuolar protein 14 C-terminal Fig4-binding domain-containing protein n=1 Tax=Synchytrium endobioticum TaxID=286115 RepID=A0A507CUG8_9FUNG|nr:hypothetical protein SeLEV6574_g05444 [Synchytrium endobioticum]
MEASEKTPSTSSLSPLIYRGLNDKLYEKRKAAALEVERLVREYLVVNDHTRIRSLIRLLVLDFAYSPIPNSRNGGLIALAAVAIALGPEWVVQYLDFIVPPILNCFTDQDSRVRYYACESMYNVAKMARGEILKYFNELFDGLSKLSADSEVTVKNGAELLDRSLKDIVCEQAVYYHPIHYAQLLSASTTTPPPPSIQTISPSPVLSNSGLVHTTPVIITTPASSNPSPDTLPILPAVPGSSPLLPGSKPSEFNLPRFIPLLIERIKTLNPFTRMFLVQWIGVLDSVPDLELIAYLPEFLEGLFGYLSDTNADIRTATLNVLGEFLKEIRDVVEVQREHGVVHFRGKDGIMYGRYDSDNHHSAVATTTTSEKPGALSPTSETIKSPSPSSPGVEQISPSLTVVSSTATPSPSSHFHIDPTRDGSLPYRLGQAVILDFGRMVDILHPFLASEDESTHATALRWMSEFVVLARELMFPYTPTLLSSILKSLPNPSPTIRTISIEANANLYRLVLSYESYVPTPADGIKSPDANSTITLSVADTFTDRSGLKSPNSMERENHTLSPIPPGNSSSPTASRTTQPQTVKIEVDFEATVDQLVAVLSDDHDESRIAAVDWLLMLHRKAPHRVFAPCDDTFSLLFRALSDPSEEVVKRDLSLIAQVSMHLDDASLSQLLRNLLALFATDRRLLEQRGALITRHLSLTLNPERIFKLYAEALEREEDLDFASTMVQNLNVILITAPELIDLRRRLKYLDQKDGSALFTTLYKSWAHNAVATFSLCLLAGCYDHAYHLISSFAELEITVSLLVQIDRLVQLLESPVFTGLRLQLLEPDRHPALYKCMYGILMLLPQSSAYATLRNRLSSINGLVTMFGPGAATNAQQSSSGGASSKSPNVSGRSKSNETAPKWTELMLIFRNMQAKHERARRIGARSSSQEKTSRRGGYNLRNNDDAPTGSSFGEEAGITGSSSSQKRDRGKPSRSDASTRLATTSSLPISLPSRQTSSGQPKTRP